MDHENDEVCLELGLGERIPKRDHSRKNKRFFFLDLSIPIHPSDRIVSAGSSSNRRIFGEDEKEGSKNSFSSGSKDDDDNNCFKNSSRKKLRLTREQTTLLEDSFKLHTTLNMGQKQALAEKLNLRPRQVEVWFQNRRARTKLKQTEVDCEFLKKKCERLSEENRILKKELFELRSSLKIERPQPPTTAAAQPSPPFFHHKPNSAAAHEKNGNDRGGCEKQELAVAAAVMEVVHES